MRELDEIRIIPGYACNLECKYCFQKDRNRTMDFGFTQEGIDAIVDIISKQLKYKDIEVLFYGGEVLIFWDRLKTIIEIIEKLRYNGNRARMFLISNGKLLTSDIVKYCNAHDVSICISYDGKNSMTCRGFNPMENKKLLYSVNRLNFHATFSAWNYPLDYVDEMNVFAKKYYLMNNRYPQINGDFIYDFKGIQEMDLDRVKKEMNIIMDRFEAFCDGNEEFLSSYLLVRYLMLYFNCPGPESEPICNWRNRGYITTDGQLLLCANSCKVMGKYTDDPDLKKCYEVYNSTPILRNNLCKDCNAWYICKGGCSFMEDDTRIENLCPITKAGIGTVIERLWKWKGVDDDVWDKRT